MTAIATPAQVAAVGRSISQSTGALVAATGACVLIGGWGLGIDAIRSAGSDIAMKTNAALGLLAAGLALLCASSTRRHVRASGIGCGVLTGALGAATLSQHLFGWDLGIDELLFQEPPGAVATMSPNRMGPNASLSFFLESFALLSLYQSSPHAARRAQLIAAAACALAIIPIVGYAYGAQELYGLAPISGIAPHMAVALLALGVGVLLARCTEGPVAPLLSAGAGGMMARRLWFPVILLPFLVGYVCLAGQRVGWYDTGLEAALSASFLAFVLWFTVWRTVLISNRLDGERAEALANERSARKAAEHAARLKDEFLAVLSHELRTPLNAMLGWTSMLRQGAIGSNERERATEIIARNGERLARLVEDLLDVSRISSGHLTLNKELLDMRDIVDTAVSTFTPAAASRGIALETHVPGGIDIVADRLRLEQILRNLVSNSIKFTETGGWVSVHSGVVDGSVELRVRDSGRGIDPAFLPHVFERFRQEDATITREHGGLGLGLSIARDLAHLHGGDVHAESAGPGQGATFTLKLPRNVASVSPIGTGRA